LYNELCGTHRFFDFARSRGASSDLAQIEHDGWSRAQLSGFVFDYLNSAEGVHQKSSAFQHFSRLPIGDGSSRRLATCRFQSLGSKIDVEATMFICADESGNSHQEMERIEAFRLFAAASRERRLQETERARIIFDRAPG